MIIHRQNFFLEPPPLKILRPSNYYIHRPTRLLRRDVLDRPTAPRIHQMIKAHTIDAMLLNEVENPIQLLKVVPIDRKSEPDALTDRHAIFNAAHRSSVGALDATKLVVHIRQPVERNAHIAHADVLDPLRRRPIDQSAVGRERRSNFFRRRIRRQIKKIRAEQRFAAAE